MLEGVIIKELGVNSDSRGWLSEIFRTDEIRRGLVPEMAYLSSTLPGISRGPHEHMDQTDYFCFIGTSLFNVYLWDNRQNSVTFGERVILEAKPAVPTVVIVPPRIVHAYKNVGASPGLVLNLPNKLYRGWDKQEAVDEIRHESDRNSRFKLD